ncbi:MAG TPA: cupin domain-containing protein [Terriglobia bacterium]|nr:cupin domain-containing protein [Terriglobia bacterium]
MPDPKPGARCLRIGDVARLVGVSRSALRSWESLGLVGPHRTASGYRQYTLADVRLLRRARFLRRVRGMNAPAILHLLAGQGRRARVADPLAQATPAERVGRQLRGLRLRRNVSLARVARACGISVGFLSSLERGHMSGSVATLRKLARFYKINILDFFNASQANPHLVRPGERKLLEAGPGVRMELLAWGKTVMEPHLFRIAPGAGSGEAYAHEGEEFLYVLRGLMEVTLDGGRCARLRPGDSFYFESDTPHRWSNPGRSETWVLWVNTPPTF